MTDKAELLRLADALYGVTAYGQDALDVRDAAVKGRHG